jgi:putative aminopeptidase FrvX
MADRSSSIQFEDIPLDEARLMGRGPRIDPELYRALQQNIQSLDSAAVRMMFPGGTSPTTMKNRILRVAAELGIPITIRTVPGGLLFWRSTDADRQQATEISQRLQTARSKGRARPAARQRQPIR